MSFDVEVFNSGTAPARDVQVEASMFNAGPDQDQEIGAFFAQPVAQGERIAAIPPLRTVSLSSAVSLTREQMRQYEVGGRRLFVPLIGFNALYSWSGGDGPSVRREYARVFPSLFYGGHARSRLCRWEKHFV